MSYCRFGDDSDVYLYDSFNGNIVCCVCRLTPLERGEFTSLDGTTNTVYCREDTYLSSPTKAIRHLRKHRRAGHMVPRYAFRRLRRERRLARRGRGFYPNNP